MMQGALNYAELPMSHEDEICKKVIREVDERDDRQGKNVTANSVKNDWYNLYQIVIPKPKDDLRSEYRLSAKVAIDTVEPLAKSSANTASGEIPSTDEKNKKVGGGHKAKRSKPALGGNAGKRPGLAPIIADNRQTAKRIVDVYGGNSNRLPKASDSLAEKPFYQKWQIKQMETDKQNRLLMKRLLQTKATISSFR